MVGPCAVDSLFGSLYNPGVKTESGKPNHRICHSIFAERNEDSDYNRYLRKRTEAVKDKDYLLSLVLKIPFGMLIPFTLFVGFRTVH